jgi:hypothetical protein
MIGAIGAVLALLLAMPGVAHADGLIKHPGDHPDYGLELEPHGLFGPFDPPNDPTGTGPGAGVRFTIPIVKNGFVDTINNSVGIGFGIDWVHYEGRQVSVGYCAEWAPGPGSRGICTAIGGPMGGPADYLYFPLVMQWNFWLHKSFSMFGEPGLAIYRESSKFQPSSHMGVVPILAMGGRWHFSQVAALTFRIGYPTFSLGISFLL